MTYESAVSNVKFYTQRGRTLYSKYMRIQGWPQNAHTVTTDNMWFPLTPERTVHVQLSDVMPGNVDGRVYAIGYR